MKKVIRVVLVLSLFILISVLIFVGVASESIPYGASEIIEQVMAKEVPQQILGDSARAQSDGAEIWYESRMPLETPKGTILLIMGLGGNAIEWPLYFVNPLVEAGYQVIRFDNRSTGLSTWVDDKFDFQDMAGDALAVMDAAGVDSAHVLGISMGGMIAQVLAIEHPKRIQSLISIMSSGYSDDPELPEVSQAKFLSMIATGIRYGIHRTEKNIVKTTVSIRSIFVTELSQERIRVLAEQSLYNQRYRRGFNPDAFMQQTQAVRSSGSRYSGLEKLKIPTLVIHGKEDPLIPVEHGIKTAAIIPNAQLKLIEGMGHDLSPEHTPQMHQAILEFLSRLNQ